MVYKGRKDRPQIALTLLPARARRILSGLLEGVQIEFLDQEATGRRIGLEYNELVLPHAELLTVSDKTKAGPSEFAKADGENGTTE